MKPQIARITAGDHLLRAVRVLPEDRVIQVAPDAVARRNCPAPAGMLPQVGVFDWQPAGDGTYAPVIRLHEQTMRLKLAAEMLGVDFFTLRRLVVAKFVGGGPVSPGAWVVNLHSYFAHVKAVQDDPDFWTEERRKQYSAAL